VDHTELEEDVVLRLSNSVYENKNEIQLMKAKESKIVNTNDVSNVNEPSAISNLKRNQQHEESDDEEIEDTEEETDDDDDNTKYFDNSNDDKYQQFNKDQVKQIN